MAGRVVVTGESDSGRNERFRDTRTGRTMSSGEFVERIESGEYGQYHVRCVNGRKTPASNPDASENNNLG